MAQSRNEDNVGVVGVNADAPNVMGVAQTGIVPGLAAVAGLINAVTVRNVQTDGRFAGAGVDHIGVGRGYRQRADGRTGEKTVGDVLPIDAAVNRFPNAAGASAKIKCHGVGGMASHCDHPPAARRANAAPYQRLHHLSG